MGEKEGERENGRERGKEGGKERDRAYLQILYVQCSCIIVECISVRQLLVQCSLQAGLWRHMYVRIWKYIFTYTAIWSRESDMVIQYST